MAPDSQDGLADDVLLRHRSQLIAGRGQGGKPPQPEAPRLDFLAQQLDDGSQAGMADNDHRARARVVRGWESTKQNEVPVLQRRRHAEPRDTNDPEAREGANTLNQADQSTG